MARAASSKVPETAAVPRRAAGTRCSRRRCPGRPGPGDVAHEGAVGALEPTSRRGSSPPSARAHAAGSPELRELRRRAVGPLGAKSSSNRPRRRWRGGEHGRLPRGTARVSGSTAADGRRRRAPKPVAHADHRRPADQHRHPAARTAGAAMRSGRTMGESRAPPGNRAAVTTARRLVLRRRERPWFRSPRSSSSPSCRSPCSSRVPRRPPAFRRRAVPPTEEADAYLAAWGRRPEAMAAAVVWSPLPTFAAVHQQMTAALQVREAMYERAGPRSTATAPRCRSRPTHPERPGVWRYDDEPASERRRVAGGLVTVDAIPTWS